MTRGVFNLAKRLRLSFDRATAPEFTDASLLTRFLDKRDESAFTQLLERHAGLVWGVCRRGLTNHVDAEDAFQATFLVLFQQAGRIRKQQSLASWLHGVAWRITRKMQRSQQRRQRREQLLAVNEAKNGELAVDHSLSEVVDSELARLPMRYREPILLCYLHGQSQAAAAQTLGWPVGTVAGRLSRAKELLRSRLIRRGVAPAIAANFAIELARAEVPAQLLEKTMHTIQIGGTPTVFLLAKGMVGTMLISKWLIAGVVGVGLTLAAGVAYSAWQKKSETREGINGIISQTATTLAQDAQTDFQLIQGHWQWTIKNAGQWGNSEYDLILEQEDFFFEGDKFIHRKESTGPASATKPDIFALKPELNPKQLVLFSTYQLQNIENMQKQFGGWGAQANLQRLGEERRLCTYELRGDELTIRMESKSGFVPYKLGKDGNVFADHNDPRATFPKADDPNVTIKVFHRVKDDSDYQKIQGRWRRENSTDNQGRIYIEDFVFRDKKCTLQSYSVGSKSEIGNWLGPRDFILDPNRNPKRMEMVVNEPKTSIFQGNDKPINDGAPERMLCNYELTGDTLTIEYVAYLPLRRDANRNIYGDRNNPKSLDDKAFKKVYRRVTEKSNSLVDRQVAQVDAERKLVDERIAALDERFKLQFQAYLAGKEPLNLVLDSIRDRVDSKIERAKMDEGRLSADSQQQIQNAVKEAFESANEMLKVAEAKHKAGGVTQLDVVTAKAARLDYELRLLRLEKTQLEKQPK